MTDDIAWLALAVFDGVAGLIIFFALTTSTMLDFPKWHRFFIAIGGAGMLSQSALIIASLNGYRVSDFWWMWAGKDICIGGLAITYAIINMRSLRT